MIEFGTLKQWPSHVIINTDGACRGNPGPSSIGITVQDEKGGIIYEYGENLGIQTNNYAEYSAVKKALELAVNQKTQTLTLRSDSEFLIKQLKGEYKVKSENIRPLYLDCVQLKNKISKVHFTHVRREFNKRADEIANMSLDEM